MPDPGEIRRMAKHRVEYVRLRIRIFDDLLRERSLPQPFDDKKNVGTKSLGEIIDQLEI
jgi:hypothetical protein